LKTLSTLIDVYQEEHDISKELHVAYDSYYLLSSSLNEEEVLSRDEEIRHILENMKTTSGKKEIESRNFVYNMEQYSHNLTEEIQHQFLGDCIIDYSTYSPSKIIFESSHFEKSCDLLSPFSLYNENNYVLDNVLCSNFSVDHTMDIDQLILGEVNTQCSKLKSNMDIIIEEKLSFKK